MHLVSLIVLLRLTKYRFTPLSFALEPLLVFLLPLLNPITRSPFAAAFRFCFVYLDSIIVTIAAPIPPVLASTLLRLHRAPRMPSLLAAILNSNSGDKCGNLHDWSLTGVEIACDHSQTPPKPLLYSSCSSVARLATATVRLSGFLPPLLLRPFLFLFYFFFSLFAVQRHNRLRLPLAVALPDYLIGLPFLFIPLSLPLSLCKNSGEWAESSPTHPPL